MAARSGEDQGLTATPAAPGAASGRIHALDVVRGVSIAGILFANVLVFFGLFVLPEARAAEFATARADRVALFLEHALVSGKFYSIFSLLFGIGFGIQLARGGEAATPKFRRRLRVLLGIGAVHALFIWAGDILMLYALLGFTLPWFARKTDQGLLRWTVGLLAFPTALYVTALAVWMAVGSPASPPPGDGTGAPQFVMDIFGAVGTGGIAETMKANLLLLVGRWADLIATMRFPKVLGMFVLGLWLARRGIALGPSQHGPLLARWATLGFLVGLPLNLFAAWAMERWEYLPPSAGGLLWVAAQGVGIPLLALGYAAALALLAGRANWFGAVFAPMGRMALTNYLMQSVICVTLAAGWGMGLWWRVGASSAMGIAAIVVAAQLVTSALWMSRSAMGPAERVWRSLS